MVIPILFFFLLFLYAGFQLFLWCVWIKRSTIRKDIQNADWPAVSVLIPIHNEEKQIQDCLQSVVLQNYPKELLEIIVINDHSTDGSSGLIAGFPDVKLINLPKDHRGKKAALQTGVGAAKGEIVLTTDGDCEMGVDWVASVVMALMKGGDTTLVTGPVWMVPEMSTFLQKYQEMEQASLNVLTFSGLQTGLILSAMGANLGYPKRVFLKLDPYADNQHIPSGDDVFFAHKLHQIGGNVQFVKQQSAMVYTNPAATYADFIRQRIRWAGKSSGYEHWQTKLYISGFASVNISFILMLIAGFWVPIYYTYLVIGLLFKFIVDYLIINTAMRWGGKTICWQDVLKASLFQVVYVVHVSLLVLANRGNRRQEA